ncbi:RNA polymerase sigma-70 factor (ECF subfamily) [Neolewinella xylanilytica]|uniref:RNA polymerase sigma-70 factor (ECF subfamily) n=1 Tax=Neolewinella xylanilytica TaxID=1514080 RepID=A0A2S6I2T9_9BACT|nr:sigma-70 family RNA polymerase sigma factor [Neolewinella xylanilytica]PPK85485.1 RNA polymerase sigma-70 factor (ECF subfamily) [Neolewinella xylanilytica]
MAPPPDDQTLIERFRRSGKPRDLSPLYERYAEMIYGWCLRYLGTPQRAEDAGAELFPVLLDKLAKHEVTNFRSWLQTLVRNHCLMQLRREKRDPLQLGESLDMQSGLAAHLNGEDATGDTDTRPLYHCLKQLMEEQRQCIRRFYLQEGESYRSIALALNLSVGQVRSHLQNGRRNLKICLAGINQPERAAD